MCVWLTLRKQHAWNAAVRQLAQELNSRPFRAHMTVETNTSERVHEVAHRARRLWVKGDLIPINNTTSSTDYPWDTNLPFHAITLPVYLSRCRVRVQGCASWFPKDAHVSLAYRVGGQAFTAEECVLADTFVHGTHYTLGDSPEIQIVDASERAFWLW